jgi:hypothetical protein
MTISKTFTFEGAAKDFGNVIGQVFEPVPEKFFMGIKQFGCPAVARFFFASVGDENDAYVFELDLEEIEAIRAALLEVTANYHGE